MERIQNTNVLLREFEQMFWPSTPSGSFAIYVREEEQRFVVPTSYLSHPLFKMLLEKSYNEYGFEQRDKLIVLCSVATFREAVNAVECCRLDLNQLQNSTRLLPGSGSRIDRLFPFDDQGKVWWNELQSNQGSTQINNPLICNPQQACQCHLGSSSTSQPENVEPNRPVIDESNKQHKGISLDDYLGCSSFHGIGPTIAVFDTIEDGYLDCACVSGATAFKGTNARTDRVNYNP
ncbi:GATA protein [Hibiscus syriacus]|uniref:GATA protein n=1 Tax=Hibiscus syriacus TaxID=106335 RepID=A0A6A2XKS4_HIBSY|nr:GATA protein [Hibiscus syriacus]